MKNVPKDVVYCHYCGASIPIDASFCRTCGKKQTSLEVDKLAPVEYPSRKETEVPQAKVARVMSSKVRIMILLVLLVIALNVPFVPVEEKIPRTVTKSIEQSVPLSLQVVAANYTLLVLNPGYSYSSVGGVILGDSAGLYDMYLSSFTVYVQPLEYVPANETWTFDYAVNYRIEGHEVVRGENIVETFSVHGVGKGKGNYGKGTIIELGRIGERPWYPSISYSLVETVLEESYQNMTVRVNPDVASHWGSYLAYVPKAGFEFNEYTGTKPEISITDSKVTPIVVHLNKSETEYQTQTKYVSIIQYIIDSLTPKQLLEKLLATYTKQSAR